MILAPRHLERLPEVTETLSALQLPPGRRSDPNRPSDRSVLLLDTTGELGRFYAAADVAFVGGTLVPIGGHNLLEPAVFGTPIVVGPHLKTVRDTASLFAEVGALVEVKDAAALAACVETMFASPAASRQRGAAAQGLIESRRGAAALCAETILAGLRCGAARERMSDG
jgi:3-deoxy-D-manno-octulosonic-acid transferase